MAVVLTREEKIAKLEPELQSLLDARKVDVDAQARMYDSGVDGFGMLAAIAVTRDELKTFAKDSLGIDGATRPEDVVKFASLFLAWQSAVSRVKVMDELNSELVSQKQPKAIPPVEMFSLKSEFEKLFYKLKDAEVPAKASFEDLCEQLDAGELRPMSLRHFGSKADHEDMETGTLQLGKSGQVKIRRSRIETPPPNNLEELRSKITLMANHFIFAKFRYSNKGILANLNPFTFLDYVGYLTGSYVARLETQTVDGVVLHKPSIRLITSYDYQMRKEVIEQMNLGKGMVDEIKAVTKNADLRERHFSTPLAVSSASQSLGGANQRGEKGGDRWHPYPPNPKGGKSDKGKGKGKKGKGKYKGDFLHSTTPDGRQLCFAWSNAKEGCKGQCGRVHACRICLSPEHPTFEHEKKASDTGGLPNS